LFQRRAFIRGQEAGYGRPEPVVGRVILADSCPRIMNPNRFVYRFKKRCTWAGMLDESAEETNRFLNRFRPESSHESGLESVHLPIQEKTHLSEIFMKKRKKT
jgi:hypothetical protein